MTSLGELARGQYVLVTTYRRDGRAVPTPVWCAPDGDGLVIWTPADAGKVKRLRNDPRADLAPCTLRGTPTGPAVAARAEIMDAAGSDRARTLIAREYGMVGRLTMLGSRLRRGTRGTVGIRFTAA
ncbi:PPOX class F420-dependent oxidoreductase [Actinocatenispora rupis]|uniref:PPOX class F420-dependent oxidoreductase n=1 Tax=Actinocatenispora rupis TaxID=519421 RepID=A0A8J3NFM4_9ACTN|nr:PPOX class F420-dependent oxidoreductase [Actinocatenispora rupis]GID13964.1 PPOX class F420-dependent oxidoreductase [Actinocatenispora rupis]